MRLHRLRIAAFGPYPGEEVVDFDALGEDGLFLLQGPTGAGKTTVLDAVAFGLFATVPGERGVKRLRCDVADPGRDTEVEVEFSVRGERVCVVRSPEYERPKKRGSGTTTQQASAALRWIHGAPGGAEDGITRVDEVTRTVQRLVGMSAQQFFQVVLLPQGEFARFLRAQNDERQTLLERLFETGRFSRIESWFQEQRRSAGRQLEQQRKRLDELLARLRQAAGEPDSDTDFGPAGIDTLLGTLAERARELGDAAVEQERAEGVARQELEQQQARAERQRRVRQARVELDELAESEHEAQRSLRLLEDSRRAAAVPGRHAEWQRAQRALAESRAERGQAGALLDAAQPDDSGPDDPVAGLTLRRLQDRQTELQQRVGELGELQQQEHQQHRDRERADAAAERVRSADQDLEQLEQQRQTAPQRLEEVRQAIGAAERSAARVDDLGKRAEQLESCHRAAEGLPEREAELRAETDAEQQARDAQQQARHELLRLREQRLDGMAGELAGRLERDSPCPVCGSRQHPVPAGSGNAVTAEQERQAQQVEADAASALEKAVQRRVATLGRLTEQRQAAQPPDGIAPEELADKRSSATAELRQARAAEQELPQLRQRETDAATEITAAQQQHDQLHTARAAAHQEAQNLQEAIQRRAAALEEGRGRYATVEQHRSAIQHTLEKLERAATAERGVQEAERNERDRAAALGEAVAAAGFDDADAARAAVLDQQRSQRLEAWLAERDRRHAAATATMSDPELRDIDPNETIDLERYQSAALQAGTRRSEAYAALQEAQRQHEQVRELAELVAAQRRELDPVERAHGRLVELSDVINGRGANQRSMSLHSYVLAARLEQVAAAASRRLEPMSQGRFTLLHSDSAGPRNSRGGLGLDVFDDYSGQRRPTSTLSGGETFLTSLALALGLADVVAAESGGTLLDTLFIDEGFGSLDPEALDTVMDTLDELRSGGRVVGLVSHVSELRQRIPRQLHVLRSRAGSRLRRTD